jgi:hypothetical protein
MGAERNKNKFIQENVLYKNNFFGGGEDFES